MRPGLSLVPDHAGIDDRPRLSIIYAFPIWEIHPATGLVRLFAADPATGQLILDDTARPAEVSQVPHVRLARADAKPRIVWDYVGQTIRPLEVREAEHRDDKCWADVIAGSPIIVEQGMWTQQQRDDREIELIHRLLPRFNYEHNQPNLHRIEMWRQVQLRHARDDAGHQPRWLPLEQRTTLALAEAERAIVAAGLDGNEPRWPLTMAWELLCVLGRWLAGWPRPARRAAGAAAIWFGAVIAGTVGLGVVGWPIRFALGCALLVSSWLAYLIRRRGRHRRRRRRKT